MGLLRDKYYISTTNIDTTEIAKEMERKNDIEEKQNEILNKTRDRVDVSLNEYENIKKELKDTKELLGSYQNFINDLATKIQANPERLLQYKLVKSETERKPLTMSNYLYLVFEICDKDLLI